MIAARPGRGSSRRVSGRVPRHHRPARTGRRLRPLRRRPLRRTGAHAPPALGAPGAQPPRAADLRLHFGATRAGALLGRLRLHLTTERFLAERRGDAVWDAACAGAARAVDRIAAGMTSAALARRLQSRRIAHSKFRAAVRR